MSDIAIVGIAFKMPQDAVDEASLWETMQSRRNLMTEWPASRLNIDAFHGTNGTTGYNKIHSRGAHFLKQDPAAFDAPFFSLTAKEAACMDPHHRLAMETSYEAFENAGIPVYKLKGSRTAVFASSTVDDYARMMMMDPDRLPPTSLSGTSASIFANRLSWYFDLQGPSVHVDTACSSSMTALDLACQAIQSGNASAALVVVGNLILGPPSSSSLSNLGVLSPDGVCYSFDRRANGYGRGEGVIALVLKPVLDAVRCGDMIRAVIRSIASNQDGRTPSITQPSPASQEELIRRVYEKAGLSLDKTRYLEAHGTGTPVGDPIEIQAIGKVFQHVRSPQEPLYVGSVKSNVGHLEGGSGLAGIVKSILVLEQAIIPPNALLDNINPKLRAPSYNIEIPTQVIPWPGHELRRVSVNSFGFGGSNTHAILDDAFHYLRDRGLGGNHATVVPSNPNPAPDCNGADTAPGEVRVPQLLVWSASNEKSLHRMLHEYDGYLQTQVATRSSRLDSLAYTLACRRTHMLWRSFSIVPETTHSLESVLPENQADHPVRLLSASKPARASNDTAIAFVFTGQGVQYVDMGMELMIYPVFQQTMQQAEAVFQKLGSKWSLFDEIHCAKHINEPEYSQPLTTALQIALVELLKTFNIVPHVVVGHSSGEIAAAYTAGALSLEAACKAAYHRGKVSSKLKAATSGPRAMVSVNIPVESVDDHLARVLGTSTVSSSAVDRVTVACFNSPRNVTLAGPERDIDMIHDAFKKDQILAHKLVTGGMSYHSPIMETVARQYAVLMGTLEQLGNREVDEENMNAADKTPVIFMVSSITGQLITSPKSLATPDYWVRNLVSPVRFSDALSTLALLRPAVGGKSTTHIIEIGPHPGLRRPIHDCLASNSGSSSSKATTNIRYLHVLKRSSSALQTTMQLVGQLFCHGHAVLVDKVNKLSHQARPEPRPFLIDCPKYPFDHSNTYWAEPRASKNYRLRPKVPEDSLGDRVNDWNPLEPSWRRLLSVETTPWAKDHKVFSSVLYPEAGMLIMAMEAVKQMRSQHGTISGFYIKEANFVNPIIVAETWEDSTEVITQLRPVQRQYEKESVWSEVKIFSLYRDRWTDCFNAMIQTQYYQDESTSALDELDSGMEKRLSDERALGAFQEAWASCTKPVDCQKFYRACRDGGLHYGEAFQVLHDVSWDGDATAVARMTDLKPTSGGRHHQTASLPVRLAVLDGAFQALMPQFQKAAAPTTGDRWPAAVAVPSHLRDAWFAADGWHDDPTTTTTTTSPPSSSSSSSSSPSSAIHFKTHRDREANNSTGGQQTVAGGSIHVLRRAAGEGASSTGTVLCTIDKMVMMPVSGGTTTTEEAAARDKPFSSSSSSSGSLRGTNLLYGIEWKPQMSLLTSEQLHALVHHADAAYAEANSEDDDNDDDRGGSSSVAAAAARESHMKIYHEALDKALDQVVRTTLANFKLLSPEEDRRKQVRTESLSRYLQWMEHYVNNNNNSPEGGAASEGVVVDDSEEDLDKLVQKLESLYPPWRIFPLVARNLLSILLGTTDPLQLAFGDSSTSGTSSSTADDDDDDDDGGGSHASGPAAAAPLFYNDVFSTLCGDDVHQDGGGGGRFRRLIELIAHDNSDRPLRILEIGAGTGGMTAHVLRVLSDLEQQGGKGMILFTEYMYTDISPGFFEGARARFAEHVDSGRMRFCAFDVERDPVGQVPLPLPVVPTTSESKGGHGHGGYGYDLVIAGGVLHATAKLDETLRNVRKLLRTGGRLVMLENVPGSGPRGGRQLMTNFAFGVLPGWWRCEQEEWRAWCPAITEEQWDGVLGREGLFSGNDLVMRDWEADECHVASILVSTATGEVVEQVARGGRPGAGIREKENDGRVVVLLRRRKGLDEGIGEDGGGITEAMVEMLQVELPRLGHSPGDVVVLDLDQTQHFAIGQDDIVVSLLEVDGPFLANMTEHDFSALQDLVKRTSSLLWISLSSLHDARFPDYALSAGFLRSMRCENIDKIIVNLSVELASMSLPRQDCATSCVGHLLKVFNAVFVSKSPEREYTVRDGLLVTGRLYVEHALNDKVRSQVFPQLKTEPWQPGPGVKLSVTTPGFLDTMEFVEDPVCRQDLSPDEVEIEAKAWGVSFRDVFVALGRLEGTDLGYDCAGIIRRVGNACNSWFKPGDRVCGSSLGCMRTYPRASARTVSKLPDSLSFDAAASFVCPGITAYYALVHVARLTSKDKILIHSASGSTGQMAIWIAKMVGAEIFATVGFQDKKQLLMQEFGIPADHIFYSRNTSFAKGIRRVTNGYGVDVVLNSLSGDGLRASWECVAAYGRFVEIGKADITTNAALPMGGFARNISFSAVDLYHVAQTNPDLAGELLKNVVDLINSRVICHPRPLHTFPVSHIEQAFRFLESGKNTGRIIITIDDSDLVPKRLAEPFTCHLDPNASYLVAGGLGGLGRAILVWMADRGAHHLIVPSRSGPDKSPAAIQTIAELQARGVTIVAPQCDVSSSASLAQLLESCSRNHNMPPIRGCINTAMALQDGVFANMTHAQWTLTIQSKVQTSWNLHRLLPAEPLDFFIMLSSLSGIYGSIAQSNYAAGCTFQDALARFRHVSRGEKAAVSIDLGWMRTIGTVAETAAYEANRRAAADMAQIEEGELMALLDIYCGGGGGAADDDDDIPPARLFKSGGTGTGMSLKSRWQLLVGVITPADVLARGGGEVPPPTTTLGTRSSMFVGFNSALVGGDGGSFKAGEDRGPVDFSAMFRQASGPEERAAVVVQAVAAKLARALCISVDDVEPSRQLSDYGVDSLMAVELRNWIIKDFGANVAVLDIMGGARISVIADLVAEKSAMVV